MSKAPDDPELVVRMPRSRWIQLIGALSELPYGRVADLIETVITQAGAQLEAPEHQADEPARAN
jgi:hypothetical protein